MWEAGQQLDWDGTWAPSPALSAQLQALAAPALLRSLVAATLPASSAAGPTGAPPPFPGPQPVAALAAYLRLLLRAPGLQRQLLIGLVVHAEFVERLWFSYLQVRRLKGLTGSRAFEVQILTDYSSISSVLSHAMSECMAYSRLTRLSHLAILLRTFLRFLRLVTALSISCRSAFLSDTGSDYVGSGCNLLAVEFAARAVFFLCGELVTGGQARISDLTWTAVGIFYPNSTYKP